MYPATESIAAQFEALLKNGALTDEVRATVGAIRLQTELMLAPLELLASEVGKLHGAIDNLNERLKKS